MNSTILAFSLLLNSYSLPIPLEKASNYDKKMEVVVPDEDLERINNRFFNSEYLVFKKLIANEDLSESGKGSTIYFVYTSGGKPLAIIKKLPIYDEYDRKEFRDELSSLHETYFYNAKYFSVPKLIGTAEFNSEDESNAYLIETVAQGKSINTLIKDTGKANASRRVIAYRTLKASVEGAAKSFAEFHNLKKTTSYSPYYDQYYEDYGVDTFEGPYGMIHGDAHLGNIFYDSKSNTTTFIDLSFMPRSLAGAPVGLDSGKFLFFLEGLSTFYGLTDEETKGLTDLYTQTYLRHNPKMTKELMNDYTILACKDFAYPVDKKLEVKASQDGHLYRVAMEKINSSSVA
jgi:hypothetical protein